MRIPALPLLRRHQHSLSSAKSWGWTSFYVKVIVVLSIAFSIYVLQSCWLYRRIETRYTVIIDCGSSGTRINVFTWDILDGLATAMRAIDPSAAADKVPHKLRKGLYNRVETQPGLDSFLDDPTSLRNKGLKPLLDWAKAVIPASEAKKAPLFLYATAGLRKLPQPKQQSILTDIHHIISQSKFRFEDGWARILSGAEEGAYGWVALNYARGLLRGNPVESTLSSSSSSGGSSSSSSSSKSSLSRSSRTKSYLSSKPRRADDPAGSGRAGMLLGMLDLGGSSLEVTFAQESSRASSAISTFASDHVRHVTLGPGSHHELHTSSFKGYGLNDAFERSVELLLRKREKPDVPEETIEDVEKVVVAPSIISHKNSSKTAAAALASSNVAPATTSATAGDKKELRAAVKVAHTSEMIGSEAASTESSQSNHDSRTKSIADLDGRSSDTAFASLSQVNSAGYSSSTASASLSQASSGGYASGASASGGSSQSQGSYGRNRETVMDLDGGGRTGGKTELKSTTLEEVAVDETSEQGRTRRTRLATASMKNNLGSIAASHSFSRPEHASMTSGHSSSATSDSFSQSKSTAMSSSLGSRVASGNFSQSKSAGYANSMATAKLQQVTNENRLSMAKPLASVQSRLESQKSAPSGRHLTATIRKASVDSNMDLQELVPADRRLKAVRRISTVNSNPDVREPSIAWAESTVQRHMMTAVSGLSESKADEGQMIQSAGDQEIDLQDDPLNSHDNAAVIQSTTSSQQQKLSHSSASAADIATVTAKATKVTDASTASGWASKEQIAKKSDGKLDHARNGRDADSIASVLTLEHPCLHQGFRVRHTPNPDVHYPNGVTAVELQGAPDWAQCVWLASHVASPGISCNFSSCLLGSPHPPLKGSYVALSGFYVVWRFLGLPTTAGFEQVLAAGSELCATGWEELSTSSRGEQTNVERYCFWAPYVVALLTQGLGLDQEHVEIGQGDIGWPLGAALVQAWALPNMMTQRTQPRCMPLSGPLAIAATAFCATLAVLGLIWLLSGSSAVLIARVLMGWCMRLSQALLPIR